MRLPLRAPALEMSIIDEIRTAPKWHVDAAMALHVARLLQKPLLVLVDASQTPSREFVEGDAWSGILSRTVNLRITDPEGITLGDEFSDQEITASHFFLFARDGILMTHGPAHEATG